MAETAREPLIDTITILLGVTVGASTQATQFLTLDSIKIFMLGALSFVIATCAGILFVKFFNIFLKEGNKINPLIGNSGVSAVPDSARISQTVGLEYDPSNYLLMHAMGPNVAGLRQYHFYHAFESYKAVCCCSKRSYSDRKSVV